jgi:hypothetical protein
MRKGGKRGPPKRCDTYNPTTANGALHLPGGHNRIYQVAISQSPLMPRLDRAYPKRVIIRAGGIIVVLCTSRMDRDVHKKDIA